MSEFLWLTPLFILLIALSSRTTKFAVAVVLLLMSGGEYGSSIAILLRIAALLLLAWIVLLPGGSRAPAHEPIESPPIVRRMAVVNNLATGIWLLLVVISVAHGELSLILDASVGLLMLLVFSRVLTVMDQATLRRSLQVVLCLYVVVSFILWFLDPGQAVVQDRLRGLAGNANLFAFYCLLLFALAVLRNRHSVFDFLAIALSLVGVVASGSRASAVAFIVLLLSATLLGIKPARRILILFAACLGAIVIANRHILAGALGGLDRSLGTRSDALGVAEYVASSSPWIGVGAGGLSTYVHSTPLSVFSMGGVLGVVILGFVALRLLKDAVAISLGHLAMVVAALTHSLAESWLVSTTGPMIAVFSVTMLALSSVPSERALARGDMHAQALRKGVP